MSIAVSACTCARMPIFAWEPYHGKATNIVSRSDFNVHCRSSQSKVGPKRLAIKDTKVIREDL